MEDEFFASPKSRLTTMLLSVFLGVFGAHRFYVGKIGTGILMACTFGGLGFWYLYDLIVIASGGFRDADGRLISSWDPETERLVAPGTAAAILDDIDALRAEVADLQERVTFSERLLSQPTRIPKSDE